MVKKKRYDKKKKRPLSNLKAYLPAYLPHSYNFPKARDFNDFIYKAVSPAPNTMSDVQEK